jgi:hypothetical protein
MHQAAKVTDQTQQTDKLTKTLRLTFLAWKVHAPNSLAGTRGGEVFLHLKIETTYNLTMQDSGMCSR